MLKALDKTQIAHSIAVIAFFAVVAAERFLSLSQLLVLMIPALLALCTTSYLLFKHKTPEEKKEIKLRVFIGAVALLGGALFIIWQILK